MNKQALIDEIKVNVLWADNVGDAVVTIDAAIEIINKHLPDNEVSVPVEESLDKQMEDAGMLSIDEMVNGETSKLLLHANIDNPERFLEWLNMKHREASILFAGLELKKEEGNMYEWALAHHAIYGEIHKHYKAMLQAHKGEEV